MPRKPRFYLPEVPVHIVRQGHVVPWCFLYFYDNKKHSRPHIHAEFGEYEATIAIDDGAVLGGSLPAAKMKLVQAWIEIHREDLQVDWKLAVAGEPVFKIEPLR